MGAALVGVGLVTASVATVIWQVYIVFALGIGLGVRMAYVPAVGTLQKWFDLRRGLATGIGASGIGAGTLVVPPLAALLIAELHWRAAYLTMGVLALVIGGGAGLLVTDPDQRQAVALFNDKASPIVGVKINPDGSASVIE